MDDEKKPDESAETPDEERISWHPAFFEAIQMELVEENIWLKNLDNKLDAPEMRRGTTEIYRQGKAARIKAYLDVITKANKGTGYYTGQCAGYRIMYDDSLLPVIVRYPYAVTTISIVPAI